MTNAQIADVFEELADLLEFQGANAFRVRAYRNSARAIRDLSESAAAIVADDPHRLEKIDGVGKSTAEKCAVLVNTGKLPQLEEILKEIPESVLALLRIPGLGPKRAAILYKELGIATLDQLKAACEEGEVRKLKGFGEKTEQAILDGMGIAAAANERVYWATADQMAEQLREHMRQCKSVEKLELAGSYRRGRDTVGDLDLLVVADDVTAAMDHFGKLPDADQVIARGDTKMSIRVAHSPRVKFQIDLRVVPDKSFGAALQYFTGSKEHNVVLRKMAKDRGLKINEYGVFRVQGEKETYLAGKSEEEVYATLDLPWFPPEIRENREEFRWAEQGELPVLIEQGDIRGDLHMHTTETDGEATLEEMVAAARGRGYSYIAITDHSKRVTMARGLDAQRLRDQWRRIDELNAELGKKFTVLKGIECDILEKGGMDLPDDVLQDADWVLASVHYGQQQSQDQITKRMVDAIENPCVSCIAHPTGRLINHREAYHVDLDTVFAAAAEHGKLLELNASPMRLDLNDVHCAAARRHGIPIVISTDAHKTASLDQMRYGILQARRAGLTKDDVANTRTWTQLKKLIGRKQ
ncbi:MAG: DNA polymerase/3'-5' exonuclease PolX [Pirellulaceae bacterium]